MKLKTISLSLILILSGFSAVAQASWSYTVWYNLADASGNLMSQEEVVRNEIKLLSVGLGAHSDNKLVYDTLAQSFKFSQHTIATSSVLVFIQGKDTTTIEIGTSNLYLDKISLTDKHYSVRVWNNEAYFLCDSQLLIYTSRAVCKNKYPFDFYKIEKQKAYNFDELIEVKLE